MAREFKLPDLGEGVHEGQVVRVLVKDGEQVHEDQPLMEVETDKAAVEIPSPHTGTIVKVHVQADQLVHVGEVMVTFDDGGAGSGAVIETKRAAETAATVSASTARANGTPSRQSPVVGRPKPASPAVRKMAKSMGVDLNTIDGTGPGGRVTRADVEQAASAGAEQTTSKGEHGAWKQAPTHTAKAQAPVAAPPPLRAVVEPHGTDDTDNWGSIRRHPASRARKTIAAAMMQSKSTIPHVTDTDDADVTDLDRLRKGYQSLDHPDLKLTLLPFVVRAVAIALRRHPHLNASYDDASGEIIYKRYISMAIGVHSERGLITPVLRDADTKGVVQIAQELAELSAKARDAKFEVNDTRGGTFTISNAGAMGGSRYSTPIISPSQAAVLALGRTKWMPWVVDGDIVPRFILPLSLSIDHRIIDGGISIPFTKDIIAMLEHPARLLL